MNILDPQGPIAAADKTILINSIAIMLAIVLPTIAAIFAFAFWFRQSNPRAFYLSRLGPFRPHRARGLVDPGAHRHPARRRRLDRRASARSGRAGRGHREARSRIQVVSLDWKWLFIYPDQRIATVNTLTVPVGAPLQFELTSASVMNVFFIPQLGSMIYTMNGMVTRLNLRADQEGNYQGLSAHFSGDGFPDMLFDVHVISPLAFPDWVASTARSDQVLNADSYRQLLKQQSVETSQTELSARRSRAVRQDRDPEDPAGSRGRK